MNWFISASHIAGLSVCLCNCETAVRINKANMFSLTFRQTTRVSLQKVNQLLGSSGTFISKYSKANMSQDPQYPPIETAMRKALTTELKPVFLDVSNESPMHNTPKQAESHFRVLVVSDKFNDLTLIKVS